MERGSFRTKIGVILATAGSAVGLGNVWRFPYMTGKDGGAAFIIIYLVAILMLGIPGMVAEFVVGRNGASNAARAYTRAGGKAWGLVGYLGVFTSLIILGFYSVVAGWCLQYLAVSLMGHIHGDVAYATAYFRTFSSDPIEPLLWTVVFILITHYKLKGGLWPYIKGFFEPIPVFMPFNVIGEFATPVSMSFRHYGNVLSGVVIATLVHYALGTLSHMILGWLPGFLGNIPWLRVGIPAVLSLYFDIFSGCMQAFIFAMLTMLYIATGAAEEE